MLILWFSSPDGKFLVFLSGKNSVESGAHSCTKSLHRIEWPMDGKLFSSVNVVDVVSFFLLLQSLYFEGLVIKQNPLFI